MSGLFYFLLTCAQLNLTNAGDRHHSRTRVFCGIQIGSPPSSIVWLYMQKRLCGASIVATFALAMGVVRAAPHDNCRPRPELNPFRSISGIFPQERIWKAGVTGYASQCKEAAGLFQLQITRLYDYGPDFDFLITEQWRAGRFEVVLRSAPDEQIGTAQITWISPCSCAPPAIASGQPALSR